MALIYEEYCLREEAGEIPDPAEYDDPFPGHRRPGCARSSRFMASSPSAPAPLPIRPSRTPD